MPDATVVLATLDRVASWLSALLDAHKDARRKWRHAVRALQKAVLATQAYAAELERGEARNPRTERHLSSLWGTAAIGFYGLDGALAERLQLKSEFWTRPEVWTGEQIDGAGISLQRVAEYTRQLLRESR